MIPSSSACVFMWSPMSSMDTSVFLKTGGISANFPSSGQELPGLLPRHHTPGFPSLLVRCSPLILSRPSQGLCMSLSKDFTAGSSFFRRSQSHSHICFTGSTFSWMYCIFYWVLWYRCSIVWAFSRRWFGVVRMTIMSMPITSLEFVHGVGFLDVAIHWKAPTSYHFLFDV